MLTQPEHFLMLHREQLLLFIQLRKTIAIPLLLCILVTWSFWDYLPPAYLLTWMLSIVFFLTLRFIITPSSPQVIPDDAIALRIQRIWLTTTLYCAAWGIGSAVCMGILPMPQQLIVLALVVGITGVVLNYTMEKKHALCIYVLNVPLIIWLLTQTNVVYIEIAIMLSLYVLFMLIVMRGQHQQFAKAILTRLENQALLNQLQREIKEKEDIAAQLQTKTQDAEAANKAKSEFLAVVSHELRTPVHGLIGMLDLLHGVRMKKEARDDLKSARRAARSLRRLVNDVLDLSKLEAGATKLKRDAFLLEECIHDALVPCMMMAEQQATQVTVQFDHVPSIIYADQGKLKQVIINLVSNAVKFTAQGKVLIHITSLKPNSKNNKQRIHFSIEDTGIGMTNDDLKHIFEPFTQFDSLMERKYDGTGLGAGIAQALVQQMGGELQVRSKFNEGTTCSFEFAAEVEGSIIQRDITMVDTHETHLISQELEEDALEIATTKKKSPLSATVHHVLVAEDDAISRRIALKRLERVGFKVTLAKDGKEAWALLQQQKFNLLLSDLRMPHIDGMTLATHIRQQKNINQDIYIIGLSAHATDTIKQQCLDVGMNAFLMKPIEPDEIIQTMQDMLAES